MEVPGYTLDVLLGANPAGEVWRARTDAGEVVALKRLTAAADEEVVRRAAQRWQAAATPYAVRLREVEFVDDDPVLVLDFFGGGCLADVLDRRERFGAGEIVTLGVPLAEALAAAHAVGLVHGNVSAANVLLTEGGMALLADLGVGQMSQSAPGPADPAVDVRAVGGLLQQALERCPTAVPAALLDAVAAAVAEDAAVRPDAASLATALRRSCPAAPLLRRDPGPLAGSRPRLPAPPREGAAAVRSAADPEQERPGVRGHAGRRSVGAGPSGRQAASGKARSGRWLSSKESGAAQVVDRPGRRRSRLTGAVPRRLLVAAAAAVILAAGAGIGWASGRGGPTVSPLPPAVTTPAAAPRAVGVDWRAELDRIDAARAVAFSAVNPALLEAADAPGSPALAADRKALAGLKARGLSADGVRHRLLEVRSVLQSATGATLRVVDKRTEVTTVDGTGQVVGTLPLRPRAAYDIELVRGPAGWRLARVTPVAGAPSTETPRS